MASLWLLMKGSLNLLLEKEIRRSCWEDLCIMFWYWFCALLFSGVSLQLGWSLWPWCVVGMWSLGVADIIGRRFGSSKLPYNQHKSWAGSISMFICGFLISIGMLFYYSALGYFQLDWTWTIQRVALVALVATVVESLPITEVVDDNITVPLVSMVVSMLSFGY